MLNITFGFKSSQPMQDVIPKGGGGAIQNAQGAVKSVVTVVKWCALTSVETSGSPGLGEHNRPVRNHEETLAVLANVKELRHTSNQSEEIPNQTKMESKESVGKVEEQWSVARMAWEGLVLYVIQ